MQNSGLHIGPLREPIGTGKTHNPLVLGADGLQDHVHVVEIGLGEIDAVQTLNLAQRGHVVIPAAAKVQTPADVSYNYSIEIEICQVD